MNLADCSELEENIMSLGSCDSWWFIRTEYWLTTGTAYWLVPGIPWVVCTSLFGWTVVGLHQLLDFAVDHVLPGLKLIWDVYFKILISSFKISVISFTELS